MIGLRSVTWPSGAVTARPRKRRDYLLDEPFLTGTPAAGPFGGFAPAGIALPVYPSRRATPRDGLVLDGFPTRALPTVVRCEQF
jgi:hypothetical protein